MFGQDFYFDSIRKYVALFGTLFNDLHIRRIDKNGNSSAYIKVPITYAPKDKMLARIMQDPNIDRPSAVPTMPLMAFEMTSVDYDGNRKLATIGRSAYKDTVDGTSKLRYQYNPVPYNFGFTLSILVKNTEDGTKIVEQILPFFTPDFTVTVTLIPEIDEKRDIPIILNRVTQESEYEGNLIDRTHLIWTLDFTMKAYLYGPVKKSSIIKYANNVFYAPSVENLKDAVGIVNPVGYVQIQPGLTANGKPTSNASLSIPVADIEVDNDFGYVIRKTDVET